jgi:hypothetical protein
LKNADTPEHKRLSDEIESEMYYGEEEIWDTS